MESSSSSTSDSESSDDQNIVNVLHETKTYRKRTNPFVCFDDNEFKKRFRFNKATTIYILELIKAKLKSSKDKRGLPITEMCQLLICLRFYATGTFQQAIGDLFNIHQTTVSNIVNNVTRAIASLRETFVKMPTNLEEIKKLQNEFYQISNFPCVIGAIDGTHIRISSVGGNMAETFRNRKGYFSVNCQIVCDANLNIRDIVARHPGSAHDTTIFNDSLLRAHFELGHYPNSYILGDSGYACNKYLLTPYLHPNTPQEIMYNKSHIKIRNTVERCIGIWKRRFPCLHLGMRLKLSNSLAVIVAVAVLHNIALNKQDPFIFENEHLEENFFHYQNVNDENRNERSHLTNTAF